MHKNIGLVEQVCYTDDRTSKVSGHLVFKTCLSDLESPKNPSGSIMFPPSCVCFLIKMQAGKNTGKEWIWEEAWMHSLSHEFLLAVIRNVFIWSSSSSPNRPVECVVSHPAVQRQKVEPGGILGLLVQIFSFSAKEGKWVG